MTKDELAGVVAVKTGVSRKVAKSILAAMLDTITEQLCEGDTIYLRGFGCFEIKEGRSRRARDPQGEGIIEIPPRIRPVFRPYSDKRCPEEKYCNQCHVPKPARLLSRYSSRCSASSGGSHYICLTVLLFLSEGNAGSFSSLPSIQY